MTRTKHSILENRPWEKKTIYGDAKEQGYVFTDLHSQMCAHRYVLTDVRKQLTSKRGRMKDVLL
jgi:hypothetical protein